MPSNSRTPKQPDGRSKKRPGLGEHRRRLFEAAVELFRQQGSSAVSVSQICLQANVSRPTFYRCFEDKAALISGLYEQSVNQPVETLMLNSLAGHYKDAKQVNEALDKLFDTIFANASYAELIFIESNDPASPAHTIVNSAFDKLAEAMANTVYDSGGNQPSSLALKGLMAACQWIVQDAIRKGLDEEACAAAKSAAWELAHRVLYR